MTIVAPVGAPSRQGAQRAAAALAQAGVAQVLLYGSLARGAQHAASDIDLVAVFDDLDYTQRWRLKSRLDALAAEADKQATRADTLTTRITRHLDGWNPARATPTEQMNIPSPPQPPHPEASHSDPT